MRKNCLLIIVMLCSGLVLAQDGSFFLNYTVDGSGNITISQSTKSCNTCSGSILVSSAKKMVDVLDTVFSRKWNLIDGEDGKTFGSITLDSDIDFGQINGDGSCSRQHNPLHFKAESGFIDGNNYAFRNVCFVNKLGSDLQRMNVEGVFDSLISVDVSNLKIENVKLMDEINNSIVESYSSNFFSPKGSLAGIVKNSKIKGIELSNINVSGIIAGGLCGIAENVDISNVVSRNVVNVSNVVSLIEDSSVPRALTWSGRYKVFLGGLVGYSINLNLSNITISSNVECNVNHSFTAAGGLVGLYSGNESSNPFDDKILKVSNIDMSKNLSNVYGGKSVGGLFGDVAMYRGEYDYKMKITNVRLNSVVTSVMPDTVMMGGLIGKSTLSRGSFIKFVNNEVDVSLINESGLVNSYSKNFYAGGFLGRVECDGSRLNEDDFISFVNSTTKGEINIAVSNFGEDASGSNSYVGGFAGLACLALNDSAFLNDASYMDINVSVQNEKQNEVHVGGLIGRARGRSLSSSNKLVNLKNSQFLGSININENVKIVYAGGLVGSFLDADDHLKLALVNVSVKNQNFMNVNTDRYDYAISGKAKVGGLCGECMAVTNVDQASVVGDIAVNGDLSSADSLQVGGLFGAVRALSSYDYNLTNTYFIGNLDVLLNKAKVDNLGYLIGYLRLGYSNSKVRNIYANYHYGVDAIDGVGVYFDGTSNQNWEDLLKSKLNVHHNIRNGENENLSDKKNGFMIDEDMRSAEFAAMLNSAGEVNDVWTYKSGENDDFPFFSRVAGGTPSSSSVISSSSAELSSSSVKSSASESSSSKVLSSSAVSSSSSKLSSSSVRYSASESSSSKALSSSAMSSSSSKLSSSSVKSSASVSSSSKAQSSSSSVLIPPMPKSSSSMLLSSSSAVTEHGLICHEDVASKSGEVVIENPCFEQSGNAIRLMFSAYAKNLKEKTLIRVLVNGEDYKLDSMLVDSLTNSYRSFTWILAPAPLGNSSLELVVSQKSAKAQYKKSFYVNKVILAKKGAWQMVSLADVDYRSVKKNENMSIYWWDESNPIGDFWQYQAFDFKNKDESTGFWYWNTSNESLKLKNNDKITVKPTIEWNLDSVYSGWNLVANPYGWYVDLSGVLATGVSIWSWDDEISDYRRPSVLKPYEAVWVKYNGLRKLGFASDPVFGADTAKVLKKQNVLYKEDLEEWSICAVLSDDFGKMDSWNVMGVASDEVQWEEPPSGMGSRVNLSIVDGGRYLAKSLKKNSEEIEWNVRLDASSSRNANLNIDGIDKLNALGKKVFVTIDGNTTEMKAGKGVRISLKKEPKDAVIRVSSSGKVSIATALSGVNAIRIGGTLNVGFNATKDLAGSTATVSVMAITGKVFASAEAKTAAGANHVSVVAPPHGLYLVVVRAGSQSFAKKIVVK